jgi:hypothetical protein
MYNEGFLLQAEWLWSGTHRGWRMGLLAGAGVIDIRTHTPVYESGSEPPPWGLLAVLVREWREWRVLAGFSFSFQGPGGRIKAALGLVGTIPAEYLVAPLLDLDAFAGRDGIVGWHGGARLATVNEAQYVGDLWMFHAVRIGGRAWPWLDLGFRLDAFRHAIPQPSLLVSIGFPETWPIVPSSDIAFDLGGSGPPVRTVIVGVGIRPENFPGTLEPETVPGGSKP